jgi:hypothetical protein
MSRDEIVNMPYDEYQYLLEDFHEYLEEEKKARDKEEGKYSAGMTQGSVMKQAKNEFPALNKASGGKFSTEMKPPKLPSINLNSLSRGFK